MNVLRRPGWVEPQHVEDMQQCWFYHRCALPSIGEILGDWDL